MTNHKKIRTQLSTNLHDHTGRQNQFSSSIPQDSCGGVISRPAEEVTTAEVGPGEKPAEYILTCNVCTNDLDQLKILLDGKGYKYSIARSLKNVPDTEQPLFRFELFFNGAYQAVGLLQGLDDLCEPAVYRRLMKPFKDNLLVPIGLDQPCSFWFTEQGVKRFADAIDEINRCVSPSGWEVRGIVLWVHEMNYLYQDNYQIALGPEFVDSHRFVSFLHAADLMDFDDDAASTAAPN